MTSSHRSLPPEPGRRRPFRYWTTTEIRALREAYPRGGMEAAQAAVPDRTMQAIYCKARELELQAPPQPNGHRGGKKQKYVATPEIDEQIRAVYQDITGNGTGKAGAVNDLARRLRLPRWWVCKRARNLGLTVPRFKEPNWTDAEDEILGATMHLKPTAVRSRLAKAGFRRSKTAISVRRKRVGLKAADAEFCGGGFYNANRLAGLLGVDAKTVGGWIRKGWLRAKRRGTERTAAQGGDQWWIKRSDLRAFIRDNAARIDLKKVDQIWFIDFVFGQD